MSPKENRSAGDPSGGGNARSATTAFDWDEPRTSVFAELRKNHSVLRSETAVALSRLRLFLPGSPTILDAGGPTANIWEMMSVVGHRVVSMNLIASRRPDVIGDLDSEWPLKSEAFDLIVSHYVLEHLREPKCLFRESFRCLKTGGVLVLSTVLLHQKHGSPRDYFRFTDDGLLALARGEGYEAQTKAILAGPLVAITSILSPFLLHAWIRAGVLSMARAFDWLLKKVLPFVGENWCSGYLLVARKPADRVPRER
jgi:SAM-dependent methyltransferase